MLDAKLKRLIRKGSLGITWPNGQTRFYGSVSGRGPDVAIQITGTLTPLKLGLHPDLYIGETYMEGALCLQRGTLWDLFSGRARCRAAGSRRRSRARCGFAPGRAPPCDG